MSLSFCCIAFEAERKTRREQLGGAEITVIHDNQYLSSIITFTTGELCYFLPYEMFFSPTGHNQSGPGSLYAINRGVAI